MKIIALDTETTGLRADDAAFGFSMMETGTPPVYFDLRHEPQAIDMLRDKIKDTSCRVVCHNASFDYRMLKNAGLTLPLDRMDDTVTRATLINEHEVSYSLDNLCKKYLDEAKDEGLLLGMAAMFGGVPTTNIQMPRIAHAPQSLVRPYAEKDARLCHDLWQWQRAEIDKQQIHGIVEFERSVTPSITEAELRGIRVDLDAAQRAIPMLDAKVVQLSNELKRITGKEVNVNSPVQVKALFAPKQDSYGDWWTADGQPLNTTPGGGAGLDAEALRELGGELAQVILELRSYIKTRDTFVKGHVLGSAVGDRVYPSIHQTKGDDGGTGTGRLAYGSPAMGQIPSRNKSMAQLVKSMFLPDIGCRWLSLDMHSFEVRVFAHLVNNPGIVAAYRDNPKLDFHQYVAELTGLPRSASYGGEANAKTLNLSMIFNTGDGSVAHKLGLPWEWASFVDAGGNKVRYRKAGPEALAVIAKYHAAIPGVKLLATRASDIARSMGYVETNHGRRLRFPRAHKVYKASGLVIQATSADINKEMWKLLRGKCNLLLNTHDSYEINVPDDMDPERLVSDIKDEMHQRFNWVRVPLELEVNGIGDNYWDASK